MTILPSPTTSKPRARPRARSAPRAQRPLLLFHLGGQAYGLPLEDVLEIVPLAELSRPPGLPALLAGFLNLGGKALPVLRLDRLFGLPELVPGLYTPLVILRSTSHPLALLVETVSRIVTISADAVVPVPAGESFNDCALGMVTLDGHVVLLLSAERLLLDKEQQCLAELQDREQARLRALEEIRP
jgi:purine-binding chemotaxis protein CheW